LRDFNVHDPIRAVEICLMLDVVVSKKFKVPKFVKYTRLECPNTHLRSYCNKMTKVICNEKLLIYFFQDSLIGSVLSWYMTLDNTRAKKWSDLINAFLKQYKFNIDIVPNWMSLMVMEKSNKETIMEYTHK